MKNSNLKYGSSFILSPRSQYVVTASLLDWGFWLHTLAPASFSCSKAAWDLNACRPLQALCMNEEASWVCWLTSAPLQSFLNFVSLVPLTKTSDLLPLCPPQTSAPWRRLAVIAVGAPVRTSLCWSGEHNTLFAGVPIVILQLTTAAQKLWQKQWFPSVTFSKTILMNSFKKKKVLCWSYGGEDCGGREMKKKLMAQEWHKQRKLVNVVLLIPMLTPSATIGEGPTTDCHTRLPLACILAW